MRTTVISPTAPHIVSFERDEETNEVRDFTIDGQPFALAEWAADMLKICAYEVRANEERIAYWQDQVRHTAERVLRGEDGT